MPLVFKSAASQFARGFVFLFYKVKEPRTIRLICFLVYALMIVIGHFIIATPPDIYTRVLGGALVLAFGLFILLGGVLGLIAVLPGIWWLERMGLISLWLGLTAFVVLQMTLNISIVGMLYAVIVGLLLIPRWFGINQYDLAPRAS